MDSLVVIKTMLKPVRRNQLYHFLIKNCQDLLLNDGWVVKIEHCYREANEAADYLVNIGVDPLVGFASPLTLLELF